MASRYSSVTRSLMTSARSVAVRSRTVSRSCARLSSFSARPRRFSFSAIRSPVELGCIPSPFPLHSAVAARPLTSHVFANVRACCELSQEPG